MTRQEKIQLLEAVRNGMPLKFLTYGTQPVLFRNQGETILHHGTDTITEDERLKWLPGAIIFENVSKKYKFDKNGMSIK